jgi:glycosyltransferase involved in cell wall biosynthesis
LAGGDQRWAADHEALAASLRIDKDLLRLGALDDNELGATLQRATCLVYPSLYEGFGIPVLEAMMCGTLVVAARAASLTEVGGEHAIYVDPEDERSIAAGLSRACEMESQERSSRLIAARSWAQSFTWERAAAETLRIYQQVCSSHDRFS